MTLPLHYLSIEEAATRIQDGSLSPVALLDVVLSRISELEPTHHAFITLTEEQARDDALEAEKEIKAGRYRGMLHGIPIAHKDVLCTKGVRTTAHSHVLRDWVPEESAEAVENLREAGSISVGKTACHEFGYGTPTPDDPFPPARNPWNVDHMPGSSSSGSGAAVAAGMVFGATGTDTGGSVRHPAAACGIVGMKPTYGLVSLKGVLPLAPNLDHVGPLTRNVRDNAWMLGALAASGGQGTSRRAAEFIARIGQPIDGLRIGVPRRFIETVPHDEEVLIAFERALRELEGLGARVVDIDPEGLDEAFDTANTIIAKEAYDYHAETFASHPERFGHPLRTRLERAATLPDSAYEAAIARMKAIRATYADLFAHTVDVVASPGREAAAETMEALMGNPVGKRGVTNRIYSLTGSPAITLPMQLGEGSLPLALQLAAHHHQEAMLYQVAAAYEKAAGWHLLHPK